MSTPNQVVTTGGTPAISGALVLKAVQTLAIAGVLLAATMLLQLGTVAYLGFAFTGAVIIHLAGGRCTRQELAATAGIAAALAFAYYFRRPTAPLYLGSELGVPGGFLGVASVMILATRWIWSSGEERATRWETFREAGLIPLLCVGSTLALGAMALITPLTFDRLLMGVDSRFGGPPSWVIGRLFVSHEWLARTCGWIYNSLPLVLAVALLFQWRERRNGRTQDVDLRWLSVTLGLAGFALYQICPAAGPVYVFAKEFPFDAPDLRGIGGGLALAAAPLAAFQRNALPSLHLAWTLLLFWNTRGRAWWLRGLTFVYLAFTAVAALGFGEHYLIDLVVAPALALAINALCTQTTSRTKWVGVVVGSAIVMTWLFALRTGWAFAIPSGPGLWTFAAWSVAIPLVINSAIEIKVEGLQRRAAVKRRVIG